MTRILYCCKMLTCLSEIGLNYYFCHCASIIKLSWWYNLELCKLNHKFRVQSKQKFNNLPLWSGCFGVDDGSWQRISRSVGWEEAWIDALFDYYDRKLCSINSTTKKTGIIRKQKFSIMKLVWPVLKLSHPSERVNHLVWPFKHVGHLMWYLITETLADNPDL